jgi:hypothetical protein
VLTIFRNVYFNSGRRNAEINKFKLLVQQAFRDTQQANEHLEKAKKNFVKARSDVFRLVYCRLKFHSVSV